jgi:peptidoglycan/LPS O-acetylase OafA/YrhL
MRFMLATIVTGCLTTLVLALMFAYLIDRQTQQRLKARIHQQDSPSTLLNPGNGNPDARITRMLSQVAWARHKERERGDFV